MVQDAIDLLAIFITAPCDTINLPFKSRAALLNHIDATQLNVARFLTTRDKILAHAGYLHGQQAVFATFYSKHDRTDNALRLYARVLELQREHLGPSDIGTLATTNKLAALLTRLQRYEDAKDLLWIVLEGKENFSPKVILESRIHSTNLEICIVSSKSSMRLHPFIRAICRRCWLQNPSVNNLRIAYNNMGELAMRRGRLKQAEQHFGAASQALPSHGGKTDEIDCQILINTARLDRLTGE